MEDILIKTDAMPEWLVNHYFKNQEMVSIEDLFATIEDLEYDRDHIKEEFDDYKNYVEDNYRHETVAEQVGIDDSDFYDREFLSHH